MPNCLFCKIIRGELPSFKVYEDEKTFAILDIHPVNRGHTLVMPKNPAPHNIFDVSSEDWARVCETVRRLAGVLERALGANGVNLMMNNREQAGQLIAEHLHIHIIPRFANDGLKHWAQHPYESGEADATLQTIRTALTQEGSPA